MSKRFRFRLARLQRVREIEERVARASWSRAERAASEAEENYQRQREATNEAQATLGAARGGARETLDAPRSLLAERALDTMQVALGRSREASLTRRGQANSLSRDWRAREVDRRALEELHAKARQRHRQDEERAENLEMDELAMVRATRKGRASRRAGESDSRRTGGTAD